MTKRSKHSPATREEVLQRAASGAPLGCFLYFFVVEQKVILTNGFVKKTPKTPPGEIDRAKRYRADYQHRAVTEEE